MASNHVLMSSRVLLNFPTYSAKSSSVSASLSGPRFSMKADQASISHGARSVLEWDWTHPRISPSPFPAASLFEEAFGIETEKPDNMLVRAGIVVVLSILLHEGRPALVKHARQDDEAAEPDVKTARWALG